MTDSINIDVRGGSFSIEAAERAIDAAVAAGHRREDLRWQVHPTQRRCIRKYLRTVAPLEILRYECETGAVGNFFAGIQYVVDPMVREDVIILEVVREVERIGMVENVSLDYRK